MRLRSQAVPSLALATLAVLLMSGSAAAQASPPKPLLGDRHQLVLDQLSGFRADFDPTGPYSNVTYDGPIGFTIRNVSARDLDALVPTDTTYHNTTIWLAPSADFFVIRHLSLGLLFEVSHTISSVDVDAGDVSTNFSLPSTTNWTVLPRIGWLFNLGDRFAIWPRIGAGWISRQHNVGNPTNAFKETFESVLFDGDVGLLFTLTPNVFLKLAPEVSFSGWGSHALSRNGISLEADASVFQFALAFGVGAAFDL